MKELDFFILENRGPKKVPYIWAPVNTAASTGYFAIHGELSRVDFEAFRDGGLEAGLKSLGWTKLWLTKANKSLSLEIQAKRMNGYQSYGSYSDSEIGLEFRDAKGNRMPYSPANLKLALIDGYNEAVFKPRRTIVVPSLMVVESSPVWG